MMKPKLSEKYGVGEIIETPMLIREGKRTYCSDFSQVAALTRSKMNATRIFLISLFFFLRERKGWEGKKGKFVMGPKCRSFRLTLTPYVHQNFAHRIVARIHHVSFLADPSGGPEIVLSIFYQLESTCAQEEFFEEDILLIFRPVGLSEDSDTTALPCYDAC